MLPLTHIILSLILAALLKYLSSLTSIQILVILLSAVLIDVDHWFVYISKKKDLSITRSYNWFVAISKLKNPPRFLCIFHTIEFFILIAILSLNYIFFQLVLIGMAFHVALDIIGSFKEGRYGKEISIIYALLRKK